MVIVFIGSGNVASHLAPAIDATDGYDVRQIYSPTPAHAAALASRLKNAVPVNDIDDILTDADIYIISIKDDEISSFVDSFKGKSLKNALWMHTSGSVSMDVLSPLSDSHGVFYPLQTFSKDSEVDISKVPLFIEGSTPDVENVIRQFAKRIFSNIYHADSELRKKMHIAAVFACNFTNYMWTIADDILQKEGLSFSVIRPLLEETLRKAFDSSPEKGQTGPAVRGDINVMRKHEALLPEDRREIYRQLSMSIYNHFNK